MNNSIRFEGGTKNRNEKIICIICLEHLNIGVELILDHFMEGLEYMAGFKFIFHKESPTYSSMIVK